MRDRLAAWHLLAGPFDVHVDPLVVACGLRERVDHGLGHGDPFAPAQHGADMGIHVGRCLDFQHRRLL